MYLVTSLGTFDNLSEFVEAMHQRNAKHPINGGKLRGEFGSGAGLGHQSSRAADVSPPATRQVPHQFCNHCHLTRYVEASGFCRFCEIDLWERLGVNVKED